VSKVKLDDLGFGGFVERNITALEAMNATVWAKEQFWALHLIHHGDGPSVKPFDGLDKLLLLSWVRKKLSKSDHFVLHYWDLRMSNIMIDKDNNIIA
jgi:hypothetical protein